MKRIYETPLCQYVPLNENDVVRTSIGSGNSGDLLFRDAFN